jgi:flagellar protein FlbD
LILLTQLNESPVRVNADLIETIESTPDTVITLTNGKKILVRETADEVVARIIAFKQAMLQGGAGKAVASDSPVTGKVS